MIIEKIKQGRKTVAFIGSYSEGYYFAFGSPTQPGGYIAFNAPTIEMCRQKIQQYLITKI